jgi:dTDP-4-dehydrorhamnose 3,5-epimerase-like enzyme
MLDNPRVIIGGRHTDARGTLTFVNDFDFKGVERFYTIHAPQPRGWNGHRRESKWFTVVSGTMLIAVVKPDHWEQPDSGLPVQRFLLSGDKPSILCVPPGHATGMVNITHDALVIVFSSGKIECAREDDYRFPTNQWDISGPSPESFLS